MSKWAFIKNLKFSRFETVEKEVDNFNKVLYTVKMKQARNSDSSKPYDCKKEWPQDCFVQCGGNGIVVESLDEAFENPVDTIKAVSGEKSTQKFYRTAFFEAFPKDPSCFLRGEGSSIEEAEADAYTQYLEVVNCKEHEFDRKGRTDGYAYCKHCSYSSTVLEPLTKCVDCGVPTAKFQDRDKQHRCMHHHFALSSEQAVGDGMTILPRSEMVFYFSKSQAFYQELMKHEPQASEKRFHDLDLKFNHWARAITYPLKPLFKKQTKTDAEIIEILKEQLPNFFKELKNG